jgi:hypothetical protein
VAGSPLGSGKSATLAEYGPESELAEIKQEELNVNIYCLDSTMTGGQITGPRTMELNPIKFEDCEIEPSSCEVSSTLTTEPLKAIDLETLGGEATFMRLVNKNESAKEEEKLDGVLMKINYEGAGCPLKGELSMTGDLAVGPDEGQREEVNHGYGWFEPEYAGDGLRIGTRTIGFSGSILDHLASEKAWSFH